MRKFEIIFVLPIIAILLGCNKQNSGNHNPPAQGEGNIYHGRGVPSDSLGENFNHYYDEDSRYVYEKKDGHWVNQLTIGSKYLYQTKSQRKSSRSGDIDLQELKDALMMSFYSTNATCFMEQYFDIFPGVDGPVPGGPGTGSFFNFLINERNIKSPSVNYGNNPDYEPYENYYKIDEAGNISGYEDGQYVQMDDMYKALFPVPTFDNLAYNALSIYDDELGEQTSVACANMDKVYFDQESGFYHIDNVSVHHGPIYNCQTLTEVEDTMVLDYEFRLSSDRTYVDKAIITVVSSSNQELNYFNGLHMTYDFSDMHTTEFVMPQ